ncbi:MAG: reverse transcriptase/maturase family protein [Candidatus Microgenomates bacterium]|jgi:hypothetical protein
MLSNFCSFQKLIIAYYHCRKKKRLKTSSAEFEFNLEQEIMDLEKVLQNHTYLPSAFSVFVVTEPKIREIFAANFRDRVVHHLLYSFLLPIFEPEFIADSYACRKGKGTHQAVKKLSEFLKQDRLFFLQADIKNYFCSINHDILFNLIQKQVNDPDILWLAKTIIDFDCADNPVKKGQLELFSQVPAHKSLFNAPIGRGLPIGNLTSQFFANVYLNELDQYVKHTLNCKYYIRYVDDFIILDENKEKLYQIKQQIEEFLRQKLTLELHPNKWQIEDARKGVDFLGYVTKRTHILVRRRVIKNLKKKLQEFQKEHTNLKYVLSCINSYYAHFRHADGYNLRRNLWEKHFGVLKDILRPADDFKFFRLK